jgi:Arm DNA-binding domain
MTKRALTDRAIKSLANKPAKPGKTYDVPDAIVPGLAIRVMPSGMRSFVLVTRFPGRKNPTRRSLGRYGAITLDTARESLPTIDRQRACSDSQNCSRYREAAS